MILGTPSRIREWVSGSIRTSAEKYAWLNNVQLAGKLIEMKLGEYIKYDIFTLW